VFRRKTTENPLLPRALLLTTIPWNRSAGSVRSAYEHFTGWLEQFQKGMEKHKTLFLGVCKMDAKKNRDILFTKIFYGAISLFVISLVVVLFRLSTHGFLNAVLH
jgi:hypothetical protein